MKKENASLLISTIIAIILLFFFIGCGTRKVHKEEAVIKKDTISTSLTQNNIVIDSNYTFNFSSLKICPIDITKPIIINGTKIENAKIEYDKKTESVKYKKIDLSFDKIENQAKTEKINTTKSIDKEDSTILYIGLFIVFLMFVFAWFKIG